MPAGAGVSAPERVPLWYWKGYSVDYVAGELRRGGYSELEAAQRVVAYAGWLERQQTPATGVQPRPSR